MRKWKIELRIKNKNLYYDYTRCRGLINLPHTTKLNRRVHSNKKDSAQAYGCVAKIKQPM